MGRAGRHLRPNGCPPHHHALSQGWPPAPPTRAEHLPRAFCRPPGASCHSRRGSTSAACSRSPLRGPAGAKKLRLVAGTGQDRPAALPEELIGLRALSRPYAIAWRAAAMVRRPSHCCPCFRRNPSWPCARRPERGPWQSKFPATKAALINGSARCPYGQGRWCSGHDTVTVAAVQVPPPLSRSIFCRQLRPLLLTTRRRKRLFARLCEVLALDQARAAQRAQRDAATPPTA